ncbi:MAG: MmgE/PrpD family protein, partial [Rhodospirillaceae bacterium]|nr:MmgE/PrpD family protein [Rhodospirillaceae bacterium]
DGHRMAMMHPGITVLPVVVALAEAHDLPTADIRAAIVAGYEAGLRVGALLGKAHYAVCHVTATAGVFGAAAAASRAMGLTPEQTLWAFGHAGTQSAGLWQFLDDGAEAAKAFHAAMAVRGGLTAARLASVGIPGATHVLEGPRGLLKAYGLSPDPAVLADVGASPLQIETVTIKSWPTCGQMHSCLDAVRDILMENALAPTEVAEVRVFGPKAQIDIAAATQPKTLEEAKFSTAFCVAFLLCAGDLTFTNFTAAAMTRDDVRDLAGRVSVAEEAAMTARFPKERPTRVEIRMTDGRSLMSERSFRRGDPEAPWTFPELVTRFDAIAPTLAPDVRRAIVAWAQALAKTEDRQGTAISHLFALLRPIKGVTQ